MKKILNKKNLLSLFILIFILGIFYPIYLGEKLNRGERNFIDLVKTKLFEKQDSVNVIICATPLQAKIAQKIIEQYPQEKFYSIMLAQNEPISDDVYTHYANELKPFSEKTLSFFSPKGKLHNITLLEIKLKSFFFPPVKRFFVANMEKYQVHTLINSFPDAEIKTFDDGTVNIIDNSPMLSDKNLDLKKIREKSTEHFTIFKDLPNAMEIEQKRRKRIGGGNQLKISYVKLFDNSLKSSNTIKDTTKILLGTREVHLKETSEKVIKEFGIKYTAMHPRQTYRLDNAITLKSNLIIEDYLLQQIEKNPHMQYEIYTFFSGAALTVKDFPNVKVFAIKPTSFPKDYRFNPVYQLFEQSNIPILEFNDK